MIAASERVRKDLRGDSVHRIVNGLSVRIEERVTERLEFVLVTKVLLRLRVKFWSVRQVVKSFSLVRGTVVVYVGSCVLYITDSRVSPIHYTGTNCADVGSSTQDSRVRL